MTNKWDMSYDIDDLIEPQNKKKNPFAKTFGEVTKDYKSFFEQTFDREPYEWMENSNKNPTNSLIGNPKEAHIEFMTPDKYLREFEVSQESIKKTHPITQKKIETYKQAMMRGEKFPMPWLKYEDKGFLAQEGFHRVSAAKQLGIEKIPVVIMDIDKNRPVKSYDYIKKQNPFTYQEELIE